MKSPARVPFLLFYAFFLLLCTSRIEAANPDVCGEIGGEWVTTFSGCSQDADSQGAYCDSYQCYCGPDFDPSPTFYRAKCRQPAWLPPASRCQYLLRETAREWRCNDALDCVDQDGDGFHANTASCSQGNDCDGDTRYNPVNSCCPELDSDDIELSAEVGVDGSLEVSVTSAPAGSETSFEIQGGSSTGIAREGINLVTVTIDREQCQSESISKLINISKEEGCAFKVTVGSEADIASGELTDTIELFAAAGRDFPLALQLLYQSHDGNDGPLGLNWTHNYHILLTEDDFDSVAIRGADGNWTLFRPNGDGFTPPSGDHSSLSREAAGNFILTRQNGTRLRFGSNNMIASIENRNGNLLTFSYQDGQLSRVTDENGRFITFAYAQERLTEVTDPAGNVYRFEVGDTLNRVNFADGRSWQFSYTEPVLLSARIDPAGNLSRYYYDDRRRVIEAIDPEGQSRSLTYPETAETLRTTVVTDKDGSNWQYSYDVAAGELVSKTDPHGGTSGYTYDAAHNLIAQMEPGGASHYFSYDDSGNLVSETDAGGHVTSYSYNAFGQRTAQTDATGETRFSYDDRGNLVKKTDSLGNSISYAYDDRGRLVQVSDSVGQSSSLGYDDSGNLVSMTGNDGSTTSFSYDEHGRLTATRDVLDNLTRYEYDTAGQLLRVIDAAGQSTHFEYDANGYRSAVIDANGRATKFAYNFAGQLTEATDALGLTTAYSYAGGAGCSSCSSGVDRLMAVTDPRGVTTSFSYNPLGKLTGVTGPQGRSTVYGYDAAGQVISKTTPMGATSHYQYDLSGRLILESAPDGSETTFAYDDAGRLLVATNPQISYSFSYDSEGRLIRATDSFDQQIDYSYDAAGRRSSLESSAGIAIDYGYDQADRLARINSAAGEITFAYDALGRADRLTFPNGVTTVYTYNSPGRLTGISTVAGSETIAEHLYTHDPTGKLVTSHSTQDSVSYSYDEIYRLTEVRSNRPGKNRGREEKKGRGKHRGQDGRAGERLQECYVYDAVGNRMTSCEKQQYLHDIDNQLLSVDDTSFSYDANGNRIIKTADCGMTRYHWDHRDRLIEVITPQGRSVRFGYDPFGRRISKTVDGVTTRYTYDYEDILFESRDGAIGNVYIHGPGIDDPLAMIGSKGIAYYHADGLGSIIALTDERGKVVQRYEYDSYGKLHDRKNRIKQPYSYSGREYDRETGLYFYRARYYDAQVGRFLSKDPIGLAGGDVNLYSYVHNDPVNFSDFSGLLRYLGNWGGPNWTGGFRKSWDQLSPAERHAALTERDRVPRTGQDLCYMHHDICYGTCREESAGAACKTKYLQEGFNRCDSDLASCLMKLDISLNALDEIRRILAIPTFLLQPAARNGGYSARDDQYYQFTFSF